MNRNEATSIVLAEAFAENGLVMLAHQGDEPGYQRMETLLSAINFLIEDLSREDKLDRSLVCALFALATRVPEDLHSSISPTADSRPSLLSQSVDLHIAVGELIENWDDWPTGDSLVTYSLPTPNSDASSSDVSSSDASSSSAAEEDEEFEGYCVGDITYCSVTGDSEAFFPVKVVRLGFNVVEVEALSIASCEAVCAAFLEERLNRCFQTPSLPATARFGGCDERLVNAVRKNGRELRLLPYRYGTKTGKAIRQRHQEDPGNWPLPTGTVYERWFKD